VGNGVGGLCVGKKVGGVCVGNNVGERKLVGNGVG